MEKNQTKRIEVSSDAATRIGIAREWMEKYAADTEILVIAHSAEAATDLHLGVVGAKGAWFGIKRFTLNVLAARLAQHALAASGTAPASSLSFTAVVARAIHSLQSEGKLSYFEPVATRPGFPVAVAKTLEELRMNEVDAESLARLGRGGKDLAALASLVEQQLKEAKLSDRAAIFRAAVDSMKQVSGVVYRVRERPGSIDSTLPEIHSIASPENGAYFGLPLLLLDVAVRSQLESTFIRELAALSPDVLATVSQGDERTITSFEESLQCIRTKRSTKLHEVTRSSSSRANSASEGDSLSDADERSTKRHEVTRSPLSEESHSAADSPSVANSLSFAKEHLFEDSAPPRTKLDSSILIRNWPGEPRECVEIVRSIQAEAAQGVPFDQMAVLLNSPGEYRSHLEEAFSRAEIPAYFAQGTTAPDPAGRAMLALLSCAAEGLSARRFAEYLSLGQVPHPEASKDLDSAWVGPRDELVASAVEGEAGEIGRKGDGETGRKGDGETGRQGDGGTRRHGDLATSTETAESPLAADPEDSAVIEGNLRAPARWERLLVDSAVIGGKDRWVRRLEGLANELLLRIRETAPEEEAKVESIKKQLRDLEALRTYALPLIERLAALPEGATWGEWLAHLRELAVNALRAPEGVLATLADLEPMHRVGPVDLYEVQLVLGPRLHDLSVKPPARRYGSVFVGSVDSARGLSFQVVFIPGLAERIFPRKIVEDPILPDEQRALRASAPVDAAGAGESSTPAGLPRRGPRSPDAVPGRAGAPVGALGAGETPAVPARPDSAIAVLMTRRDRLELERLALRIALGSARERAYLSYPRIDVQQSRPRVPSFYALEALRAAEGVLPGFEEIAARAESTTRARLGWPAPERPEAAIDEAEYDLALLASLVEANDEAATGRAHYLLTANKHLARALRARSRRWLRRWTPNDGLVEADELARRAMASHQFSARSFSATALQNYASCPYRFFLSAILRLEMRQEPAAIEVIDPLTRGSLFHETQFEVLTALKTGGLLPLRRAVGSGERGQATLPDLQISVGDPTTDLQISVGAPDPSERDHSLTTENSLDRAFDLVDRALDRLARDYEDRLAPAIPRVWQDGINSIRADLREWLRRMANSDDGWVPEKFELSFGLTDRGPRDSDPDSVSDPVEIIGDFRLRGSIDLVERHASGKYRVTDHKTGKARAEKDTIVGGGKYLQPLLYALAAQKVLDEGVESGRLYYCTADGGYEERVVPLDEFNLQAVTSVLTTIRQALADAFLPAAPEKGACGWCDFLAVCGSLEEMRTRTKPGDRLVQLKRIRELP